jgi:KipI family sensor histidine kinase inhibitor
LRLRDIGPPAIVGIFHRTMQHSSPALPAPKILPCGDSAVSVEFANAIDAEINARVRALDRVLRHSPPRGMTEAMPSYAALLVFYDPQATSFDAISSELRALEAALPTRPAPITGRRWRIPVVYGGEFGFDLDAVSQRLRLDQDEIVARHTASMFKVFMIGFLPGFTYLGGLDPALAVPRRPTPRAKVPAGSIVIGGIQAAIGSIEGPSGWHVIGRTPVRTFHPTREPVVFLEPGDAVTFESIAAERFRSLDGGAASGGLVAERIT